MKRSMVNENSTFLWHKRLDYISKERLERLVKNEILLNLDFNDFSLCVECIKGKQTKHSKKYATRSSDLLEIIHTDIYGPFDTSSFTREKYYITFIDDFSRYGYVYLLHEKSQSINALEVFVNEVKRQLDRKVKIIRSNRGSEYCRKYNETGQCAGLFAKVPSKSVPKTHFDLWTRRKPSLGHVYVWGCPAEARVYNLQEKKLDSQTVSDYFIGYPEKSKSGNVANQVVNINEIRDDDPSPMDVHKSTTTPDVVPVFQNQEQYLNNEQTPHEKNNLPT
ncbi:retrovirus-related pol polyprotein from transposon TNT 1-94 [Tanacetum coccineum]